MKIAFFGTPEFAAKILENLADKNEVKACITSPDARRGRGKKFLPSEVKKVAVEKNIEVYQPSKLDDDFFELFKDFDIDIAIVVAYGRIIPEKFLNLPKYGFVNIHASILPKWRGAAPIHRAILEGDKKSGISIMQMDKGLDTGDVLKVLEYEIKDDDTTGILHDKLLDLGIKGILEYIDELESGNEIFPIKQDDSLATYAHKIKKEMAIIDWDDEGKKIERLIKGLNPYPVAKTNYNGELLKIYKANFIPENHNLKAGEISQANDEGIKVACKDGYINIKKLQKAGSKAMNVDEFLRGKKLSKGDILS